MTAVSTTRRRPVLTIAAVVALLLSLLVPLLTQPVALAATFTVTNTNDSGIGSLRQAILDANQTSVWYVTNGLLVVELITGQMQVGDADFVEMEPAEVPVAGDYDDPDSPTYATFTDLLGEVESQVGETITQRIARDGTVSDDANLADRAVTYAAYDDITGHNIAEPFWNLMHATGLILVDGIEVEGPLFTDPLFAIGRPVTEAYWATVMVAGTPHDVLMQCFERRCLTYTPENDPEWQVEAGNVGLHYFVWRYGN